MPDPSATDLAARVARIEDRFALQDLVLGYCRAMDASDWESLAPLFAETARFAGGRTRSEVVANLTTARGGHGRTSHTPTGLLVEFTGPDSATGVVPTVALLDVDGVTLSTAMTYDDEYVREDGAWRFARRRLRYRYALPWPEMATALVDEFPVRWPGAEPAADQGF